MDKSGRDLLEPIGNARRKQHDQVLCQFWKKAAPSFQWNLAFNNSSCFYGFSFLASREQNCYGAAYITNMSDKILLLLHFRLRTASSDNSKCLSEPGGRRGEAIAPSLQILTDQLTGGQIIAITLILALSDFQILLRPSMSDSGFLILDDSLHCSTASKADVRWN